MAKRKMNKSIKKKAKAKRKKEIKKQNRKNYFASRKPKLPKTKQTYSTFQRRKELKGTSSYKDSVKNKIKVLLPD